MTTTDAQHLADRLTAAFNGASTASSRPWLWRPLLQLLADGEPVSEEQIATATGRTVEQVRDALAANPDTEYDQSGSVVGSGLTQNPTAHRFEVDGKALYTWCALDTLVFPPVIGRTAQVTSPCFTTGTPVHLTVTPDGITHVEPATAVVSIVTPDAPASIRAAFCNQVHFFATADAAKPWLAEHPEAAVLPVADAYELGRPLAQALLSGETASGCC